MTNRCCVYVIECQGFVKIGYTNNVMYRLGVHQVGNPFPIYLIGWGEFETQEAAQSAEARMHARFAPWLERGEWHKIDPLQAMRFLAAGALYKKDTFLGERPAVQIYFSIAQHPTIDLMAAEREMTPASAVWSQVC